MLCQCIFIQIVGLTDFSYYGFSFCAVSPFLHKNKRPLCPLPFGLHHAGGSFGMAFTAFCHRAALYALYYHILASQL